MPVCITLHVLGEAVQDAAHQHLRSCGFDVFAENGSIIGLGEYGFRHVTADLALVYVECGDHIDIERLVSSDFPMHQADSVIVFISVVIYSLHKRACAVSDTDDGDIDIAHNTLLH